MARSTASSSPAITRSRESPIPGDAFNAYANFAVSQAFGENIISNQYEFSADDLAYIHSHYIYLDHNQTYSGSFGASYSLGGATVYADLLYQSGLRRDIDSAPNGGSLPAFSPLNLGVSHLFHVPGFTDVSVRFDVVNVSTKPTKFAMAPASEWARRNGARGAAFTEGLRWHFSIE